MTKYNKAIITGATSGFGLAYKNILSNEGTEVFSVALTDADLNCDLTKKEGVNQLIDYIRDIKPDLVILNAGFGNTREFETYTQDQIIDMAFINGVAHALVLNAFFPDIIEGKMKFAVASSIASKLPSPLMGSYSASKAYASNLIDSLNGELLGKNSPSFILDITPGNVKTVEQTEEVINFGNKVIQAIKDNKRMVVNNDVYYEVLKKPHANWESFVKDSFDKKWERVLAKKKAGK